MYMDFFKTTYLELNKELDYKEKEFNYLCYRLDKLIEGKIDPNDFRLLEVKKLFQKNHDEIEKICMQMKKIKRINKKK